MKKVSLAIAAAFVVGLTLMSCNKSGDFTCNCETIIKGAKQPTFSREWRDVEQSNVKPICDDLQNLAQKVAEKIGGAGSKGECQLLKKQG